MSERNDIEQEVKAAINLAYPHKKNLVRARIEALLAETQDVMFTVVMRKAAISVRRGTLLNLLISLAMMPAGHGMSWELHEGEDLILRGTPKADGNESISASLERWEPAVDLYAEICDLVQRAQGF